MNKVLRYTIETVDKSVVIVRESAQRVTNLAATIRKALGGIGRWAARELQELSESPQKAAIALGLAAAAGKVWNSVIKTMVDRAREAKKLLAEMVNENLANTLSRQASGYDRLKESIEGAADAAGMLSRAQGSKEQAAGAAAVTGLQAQKAEALAGVSDEGERARIAADYDKRIRAAQIEAKAAEAARGVADAEREAADNAERRKTAQERIANLAAQVTEENKRLAKAQDAYASEGYGFGDRARGTLKGIFSLDAQKGIDSRFRDRDAAKSQMDESEKRLATLSKQIEQARKDLADAEAAGPAAQVSIDAAKTRLKTVDDEKRIAAAEGDAVKAAKDASKARKDYADSIRAEADAMRERSRELSRLAASYGAAAERLSGQGAAQHAAWETVGFRDMDKWRAEEAQKKADFEDEAKFERALRKAQDRERRLGDRSLKKSDKELIEFGKKQADELKKAADKAMKAEALANAQREREAEALAVQKKIRDLLDANLQMDGGGNGGGPE